VELKYIQVNEVYEWKYVLYISRAYSYPSMGLIPICYSTISGDGTVTCMTLSVPPNVMFQCVLLFLNTQVLEALYHSLEEMEKATVRKLI
jgi:hypothetical protein